MNVSSRFILLVLMLTWGSLTLAQPKKDQPLPQPDYRPTSTLVHDLLHTKLALAFDLPQQHVRGQAWLTLRPHAYPTDSVVLDAKGMHIQSVELIQTNRARQLTFRYDSLRLFIKLNRPYAKQERFTLRIGYQTGSDMPLKQGQRGIHFINPTGAAPHVPTQIWTKGQPQNNSTWFPTLDQPNQKMTQQIELTIPRQFSSLSNGQLVAQQNHTDGTRTDVWRLDLPHAPYLTMMAVGKFTITKDRWRGKEVS